MHLNSSTAYKSAIKVKIRGKEYIFISTRLPFGGSPCPNDFCLLSDIVTDTINDLLECKSWDHERVHSEYYAKIPIAKPIKEEIPFAQAREMSVELPIKDRGKANVFIDNIISVAPDIGNNLGRLRAALYSVLHAFGHKMSASSTSAIPRDNLIADDKNEAEGAPEEVKICLGWTLDTRQLLVKLPFHKYTAWQCQIKDLLSKNSTDEDELGTIVGRLENVTIMLSMMGHFLNNIGHLLTQLRKRKKIHKMKLNKRVRDDLKLSLLFLDKAAKGIDMNLIVFRKPTVVHVGDASEHGMGAFASHGRAWNYLIPEELRGRAHINLLEFLTQVVSIWVDIIEGVTCPLDCILCIGDSTSALGWLRRSNFREKDEDDIEWIVKQQVARKLASLILGSETVLYHQWLKGIWNVVADSLSRDLFYLSLKSHETFLKSTCSNQLPKNFHITPLPKEICCFITSVLQQLPVKKQRLIPQKPSELAHGNVGILSSIASGCQHVST
jgi:hypothetical protein